MKSVPLKLKTKQFFCHEYGHMLSWWKKIFFHNMSVISFSYCFLIIWKLIIEQISILLISYSGKCNNLYADIS